MGIRTGLRNLDRAAERSRPGQAPFANVAYPLMIVEFVAAVAIIVVCATTGHWGEIWASAIFFAAIGRTIQARKKYQEQHPTT